MQILQEILHGLLIGVGVGLTTTSILGLRDRYIARKERREQIEYIKNTITDGCESLLNISLKDVDIEQDPYDIVGAFRYFYFDNFIHKLKVVLTTRTTRLTYKENASLWLIVQKMEQGLTGFEKNKAVPHSYAQSITSDFRKLEWLKLEVRSDVPNQDSSR